MVRVDPAQATLDFGIASRDTKGQKRTAAQWAALKKFVITINAGMFSLDDHLSNVGYLRQGEHVNQSAWKPTYQSVLIFGPRKPGFPAAQILDRDEGHLQDLLPQYTAAVQNLRLIKSSGANVWKSNKRKWSESLVAIDDTGRLLFMFSRSPFEMADLNDRIVKLSLGIVRAFHAEGGPEASLSIHAGDVNLDLCGSYETGFNEDDLNGKQWPVPNVIGVH